tara:strand:- start:84 stop:1280 length:1197 start_codon:yes stop_codon:yes gene_type:complete
MSILEQIKSELPWLSDKVEFDLTRGKPSPDQLSMTEENFRRINVAYEMDGIDLRNYGTPEGIPSARELGSKILSTPLSNTLALDNSSLTLMQQILSCSYHVGFKKSKLSKTSKFLCPVPGYDRHFKLIENFGVEMIPMPFQLDGPDLDSLEYLLKKHKDVQGIVCVPRHSNPTGHTYSDTNVRNMFELLQSYNENFMVLWDNAYACHDLKDTEPQSPASSIAEEYDLQHNLFILGSTSKITLAGSGIAFFSSSKENNDKFIDYRNSLTPGPNKINQGLHTIFFQNKSLESQMEALKKILLPKFEMVDECLDKLREKNLCEFTSPTGGYFVSFESTNSRAQEIIDHCLKLGLRLLPVGSCFPYGNDPNNSNIRIAPTYPNLANLDKCLNIFEKVVEKLN